MTENIWEKLEAEIRKGFGWTKAIKNTLAEMKEEWDAILKHHITQEEGFTKEIMELKETIKNMEAQEKAYMSCIDELKEKAELWDQYAIYDNDKEAEIPVKDLITAYEKLEAVRTWLTHAKAQGYISISKGEQLDEILEGEG